MGTFIIKPTIAIMVAGNWFAYDGTPAGFTTSNADLITGARNPATTLGTLHNELTIIGGLSVPPGTGSSSDDVIHFDFSGDCIYLDGSLVPISFAGLPAGFTPVNAFVKMRSANEGSDATYKVYLQFDPFTESANLGPLPAIGVENSFTHPAISSILNLYADGFGLRVDNTTLGQRSIRDYVGLKITGAYSIVASSYTIDDTKSYRPGDTVRLVAAAGLNLIDEIAVSDTIVPQADFLTQTAIEITFAFPTAASPITSCVINASPLLGYLGLLLVQLNTIASPSLFMQTLIYFIEQIITTPASSIYFALERSLIIAYIAELLNHTNVSTGLTADGRDYIEAILLTSCIQIPVNVSAYTAGVQFGGSVAIRVNAVLLADSSGIYSIEKDKTNDTLYDRLGTTEDVKIPNPYAKTGFIGG